MQLETQDLLLKAQRAVVFMSVVKGAVIKGDAAFMVILNANYTPTKRKADLFGGAAAADSCTDGVEGFVLFFFAAGLK